MKPCSCGQLTEDNYTQCARCEAFHVLGLTTDATESEVRKTNRLLVEVWRPDRFQDSPELKQAAEEKLKDIHAAFEYLSFTSTERSLHPRPVYTTTCKGTQETVPNAGTESKTFSSINATQLTNSQSTPAQQHWKNIWAIYRKSRTLLRIAAILVLLLTGKSIWTYLRVNHPASDSMAGSDGRRSAKEATENAKSAQSKAKSQSPNSPEAAQGKTGDFVTLGSTSNDVLAKHGPPTASTDDKLVYGNSVLFLKDGRVIGWRIDPASSPIRVKMWPSSYVDPTIARYTVGSSKDVVLTVQGTPTAFSDNEFEYGKSVVYFRDNKVVSWKEDAGSTPLWIQ